MSPNTPWKWPKVNGWFTHGSRQWAAVRTCVLEMRVAPQYWPLPAPSRCTRAAVQLWYLGSQDKTRSRPHLPARATRPDPPAGRPQSGC